MLQTEVPRNRAIGKEWLGDWRQQQPNTGDRVKRPSLQSVRYDPVPSAE